MKVIHISYSAGPGGAGIAARRIHEALLSAGVHSEFWCFTNDYGVKNAVILAKRVNGFINLWKKRIARRLLRLQKTKNRFQHSLNLFDSGLVKKINDSDADIVHLHWVCNELISISEIGQIKKPIVWTLHDMWPICGSEHAVMDDYVNRYKEGYHESNRNNRDSGMDWDRIVWERKKLHWNSLNVHLVPVSKWMAQNVESAKLWENSNYTYVPNIVDVDSFRPRNKDKAKEYFGLPKSGDIILFNCPSDPYKGIDLLEKALSKLVQTKYCHLVAFGKTEPPTGMFEGLSITFLGRIEGDENLAKLYSAADVMCVPSQLESFGLTVAESMACGTPPVVFESTGQKEIVEHKQTGYLAAAFEVDDFSLGVEWLLDRPDEELFTLAFQAREKITSYYASRIVTPQYLQVYRKLLK